MPTQRDVEIEIEPGTRTYAYLALPDAPQGAPGVVVLGEIWGVNGNIRKICDRLAAQGIVALAPDQYRGITPPRDGDPQDHVMGYFERFDDPQGIRDGRAMIASLRDGRFGVAPRDVHVWGFCMGGRFAHYLAAFAPGLAGVINFYGRVVFPRDEARKPFMPLDVAGLVACPYLGLFGAIDPLIPAPDVAALRAKLAAIGVRHHVSIYESAEHAFFNETRASYHPDAAADAWRRVLAFVKTGAL
ncbi:dienelactone hydrolase family protein [Vineibacter terrae]|uniref:dienelactone hydrolase family protein n=1 Tax=Vineibacter terrae TaxID=2586908 RepID=UPI002E33D3F1|nr:dienelactone hydrolase family protein [Vineibacter terrae]HEX2885197.1 dienelactone hydrolase family protein [Vineibacter terrae]